MPRLAPVRDGFFNQAGFAVMPGEKLGLAVYQFGEVRFKCFGDLRV